LEVGHGLEDAALEAAFPESCEEAQSRKKQDRLVHQKKKL